MSQLLDVFSQVQVFRKFNEAEQEKLIRLSTRHSLEKGKFITFNGDLLPYSILISKGSIIITKESSEGRPLKMRELTAPNVFWGHALFDGNPTYGTLRALEPCIIYKWHGEDLLPILMNNNEALWDLCLVLHERMREASATIDKLAFSCVGSRLAQFLLSCFTTEEQVIDRRVLTLDNIASEIGTTKEVVCRLLHKLSKHKLILLNRKQIILSDRNELEKFAEGTNKFLFYNNK